MKPQSAFGCQASALLTLALALAAPASYAQVAEEVKGRILPARGERRLPDSVMVTIRSERGSFVETHPVHTTGNFAFVNVPPGGGDYVIEVTSPNRQMVTHRFQLLPGTTGYSGIAPFMTIELGPLQPSDTVPAEAGRTLSANWMKLPENVREELKAAYSSSARNDHEQAVEHLLAVLETEPLYFVYNNLAVEYLTLGRES